MKHKLSDLRHMNAWIVSNIVVLVVFTLYSVFVSDYTISNLATPAILNTGGLSLYHFCGSL